MDAQHYIQKYNNGGWLPRFQLGDRKEMKTVNLEEDLGFDPRLILDFIPGVGDALAVKDAAEALAQENYKAAAILGIAATIGLIPGVGDAIAMPLKAAMRKIPAADMQGIVRALKAGDKEFLSSYAGASTTKAIGARPFSSMSIIIQKGDDVQVIDNVDNAAQVIHDALGGQYSLKTIRNKLSSNQPIVDRTDGTIYRRPGEGDNYGPVDITDKRETTLGKLGDYEGTFTDLMRDHGIDPLSDEASTIRRRMERGHDFEGVRRTDKKTFLQRQQDNLMEHRERTKGWKLSNTIHRMEKIGLDTNNKEAIESFHDLWISHTGNKGLGVPTERSKTAGRKAFLEGREAEWKRQHKLSDNRSFDDRLKDATDAGNEAKGEVMREFYNKRVADNAKTTQWKRWFKKYAPHLLKGKTAAEQRAEIVKILESSYLGRDFGGLERKFLPDE